MGVLFLLRAPGESCGTAKSSFGKEGGRGGEGKLYTRAFSSGCTTENAISERSIRFVPPNTFLQVPSSGFSIFRATCTRSNVSLVLRPNLPICLSSPGENKSRLLKTNLLTIQKNRDASNNRDSIIWNSRRIVLQEGILSRIGIYSRVSKKGSWCVSKINLAKFFKKNYSHKYFVSSYSHEKV